MKGTAERTQMRQEHRDLAWIVGLAAVLVVCLTAISWPGSGHSAGDSVIAPPPPDLRTAPWASQPDGSPTIEEVNEWPSVVFPVGVGFPSALRALYVSSRTDGVLPPGTDLGPPLPAEVVLVAPADQTGPLRVSLLAPWGWADDSRRIRPPSLRLPADLRRDELKALVTQAMSPTAGLPEGVQVDVPALAPCQVAVGTPERRPSCD